MTEPVVRWDAPPPVLAAAEDEVHLWLADLDRSPDEIQELGRLLAADERARAARFHFAVHRDRFIAGHGMLRRILARYTGGVPAGVRFAYNSYGRPELVGDDGLSFNLSHSGPFALLAVARGRVVGADIERLDARHADLTVAERFFSTAEVAALRLLGEEDRVEGFYNCWTRKEAYVKACGVGLSMPLADFSVSLTPGDPARFLGALDAAEAQRWSLLALRPAAGYVAAVAVDGQGWLPRFWQAP